MDYCTLDTTKQTEISSFFSAVFTASESENEGALLGKLTAQLASHIDNEQIICFGVYDNTVLIGCIFFTRLAFKQAIAVYMLAPVAVLTEYQGKGIGQKLINYGLAQLAERSVEVVVTYGDPAFYTKVGFTALPQTVIQAPLAPSMPFGWLGQSLTQSPIPTMKDRPKCVTEFNDPIYW